MPIRPPALDDRSFDDLVAEALSRIPAHTPEWTNPRLGDPGRTIIELFAWLTETLLYRANLIPERQRLVFLRLLGVAMRPATAARGVVALALEDGIPTSVTLAPRASLKGPVAFETRDELTVLPVTAAAYYKRPLSAGEQREKAELLRGLHKVYRLPARAVPVPYATTPVFVGGAAEPAGFDVVTAVDRCLWLALLAPKADQVAAVRSALGSPSEGRQQLLNVGVVPALEVPGLFAEIGARPRVPHVWEISGVNALGETEYHALDRVADTTEGLTQRGVLRLALPDERFIGAPANDVRVLLDAGVGDLPPRLDVPETAARLVTWIRLRPTAPLASLRLTWVGINAVDVDQRQTIAGRVIGQSTGAADQELLLPARSVEAETLVLQVDEAGRGYQTWTRVDDLAVAGRDDRVYVLDAEAGTVRFGDGVRGRIPEAGRRVRVALMRAGGGAAGNLPTGSLTGITARDLRDQPVQRRLSVRQSVKMVGGDDPETLTDAERRIPALFRNRDRAVTEDDYRHISAATPGVRLGRVEVLPRFKPQQRRENVPGVVTVLVLPQKDGTSVPAPRPDRPTLEAVHAHLDARRALGTELYVIGCEYVPVGLGVGVTVRDGFGHDAVAHAVAEALRAFLWPLAPGGTEGRGWPLGHGVNERELAVTTARVSGVNTVAGIKLFTQKRDREDDVARQRLERLDPIDRQKVERQQLERQKLEQQKLDRQRAQWRVVPTSAGARGAQLDLERWQLPELLTVVVATDGTVPVDLRGIATPVAPTGAAAGGTDGAGKLAEVPVPVVPEVC